MKVKDNIPLIKFQKWMQQLLLDPFQQTAIDPRSFLPKSYDDSSIEDIVMPSEKLDARDHLAIYQRSYIARLRNCMSQQFSALEYALGEDIFHAFADDYLASVPSHNYNLALLGKHFPGYLEKNRPDAEEDIREDWIEFMIELANFEYDLGMIFDKFAEEQYTLATMDTPEKDMCLVPICELFKFRFPVRSFYTSFKNSQEPSLPFEHESHCVVIRYKFKLAVYDLHKEQYEFLSYLKKGMDMEKAKLTFQEFHLEENIKFEQVWDSWKNRWIEAKMFRV